MNTIRYGSVCSGIEAASCAWHPLGWEAAWFSEIEPFPKAVLAHHHPTVPDLGDMTAIPARILAGEVEAPDLLVGGTPCQSFSIAGLRRGLADPRGQLTRTFVEILDAIDTVRTAAGRGPALALWENVPGVLSDSDNAFGNFLAAIVGEDRALDPPGGRWSDAGCVLGPTRRAAWRVLDAQYFGLAQRRRRVFLVVGSPSGGVDPVEVLLVEPGVRRDSPPSREARQGTPTTPGGGPAAGRGGRGAGRGGGGRHGGGGGGGGVTPPDSYSVYENQRAEVAGTVLTSHSGKPGQGAQTVLAHHHVVAPTLTASNDPSRSPQSSEVTAQVEAVLRAEVAREMYAFNFEQYSGSERPISPCLTQSEHKGKTLVYEGGSPPVAVPYDLFMVTEPRNRQNRDENSPCHTLARDNAAHAAVVLDAGREVSPTLTARMQGSSGWAPYNEDAHLIPHRREGVAAAWTQNSRDEVRLIDGDGDITGAITADAGSHMTARVIQDAPRAVGIDTYNQTVTGDVTHTLRDPNGTMGDAVPAVAVGIDTYNLCETGDVNQTLKSPRGGVAESMGAVLQSVVPPDAQHFDVYNHRMTGDVTGVVREQHGTNMNAVLQFEAVSWQPGNVARGAGSSPSTDVFPTLKTDHGRGGSDQSPHVAVSTMAVRRLTPVECERLQGFQDEWTRIPWKGRPADECPDGARYRALGNSMAVPVMAWIGRRVDDVRAGTAPRLEDAAAEVEADALDLFWTGD